MTRSDNAHAKAGNMNNGLRVSSGDFVAIFDADFVPYRHFFRRTLPFFSDETIGIVQTPQHFFNVDPVQANLGLENIWPDEQRRFFDEIAPSRDGWDVSFCCGSCSIARRKAVEAIGGFPTEPITAGFIVVTALGIVINIVPETARIQGAFSPIAALWAGINIKVLVIASLICFEKPRRLFKHSSSMRPQMSTVRPAASSAFPSKRR